MKKFITIIGILLTTVLISGAQNKETRNLADFDKIKVAESINLYIEQGAKNEARIETNGIDVGQVLTEIRGSRLYIHLDRGNYFSTSVDVWVTYKEIRGIAVSSSASLKSKGVISADEFSIDVSSSGRAELAVDADELDIDISSSGRVKLSGTVGFQRIEVSSSGRLEAFGLKSKSVRADLSSSGMAEVTVSDEIIADASSSGRLYYKDSPDKVIVDSSSSGRVRKAN